MAAERTYPLDHIKLRQEHRIIARVRKGTDLALRATEILFTGKPEPKQVKGSVIEPKNLI